MWALFEAIILIALAWGLAFYRVPTKIWTIVLGLYLIVLTLLPGFVWPVLIALWILFLLAAVIFNFPSVRLKFFIPRILKVFRSLLPSMSDTEREALEAGDVWWEGELFRGQPDWKKLLALPKPSLSAEEQAFMDNQVESLCAMINDWDIVHQQKDFPKPVWDYLKQEGFFGLVIPKEHGGHGFSAFAHSNIVTKIASRSVSVAVSVMVPNSLGPAELIHRYGTSEQKHYYLPRLASGEDIPCFGLTSPVVGSDASGMLDNGIVCKGTYDGKEVIGIRLNWDKRYITLAPIATVMGLAFKLFDPDHLLGEQENIGITLCLVPTHLPGIEKGLRHAPLGLAFMNGPIQGKDVFVPLDFIIGGPSMRGKGWRMMMEALAVGRGISIPALGTANAKLCYRMTGAYAQLRKQFGLPIGNFEGVAEALARIGGLTYLCEATRHLTISGIDQGIKPSLATAITKYHLTEMGRRITDDAMDIHAGRGIQLGPRNYLGLAYQGVPIGITVEGANILTRNLIIFGQGAMRCHPYVRAELEAVNEADPQRAAIKFDRLLCSHIGFAISNVSRVFAYGLSGGQLIQPAVTGPSLKYYRQLTRMSAALALTADIAMLTLGGKLKRKERLSARLGDVLSQLYLASALLKYADDHDQASEDTPFIEWGIQTCLQQIQIAFDDLLSNFAPHWLGRVLRFVIFPWGRSYKKPLDELEHKMASEMMHTSKQRDRITEHCFVGKNSRDATGLMEEALQAKEAAELASYKLQIALREGHVARQYNLLDQLEAARLAGILFPDEVKLVQNFETLRQEAMQVDAFDQKLTARKTNHDRRTQAKSNS